MDNKQSARSWFCVFNNPQEIYEGEPREIAEKVLEEWIGETVTRTGAVAYCISADGLHHLHMVLEDNNKARFSAIKKIYPKAHLEPTKGTKEQAEDYIKKRGKWEEKGEQVLYIARFGEIKGNQGARKDFEILESLIEEGMTPQEIMALNMRYRRYEKYIKDAFFYKRKSETPFLREVKCIWHVGESGSGKTYVAKKLIEEHGENNVYMMTDYDNGGLDNYCGEQILFMDEFRGQIRFSTLLSMLQGYKSQFHARYTNCWGLWNEVHITSVMPPERIYSAMVKENNDLDTIKQLLRRIESIVYHYKEPSGEYKEYSIPMVQYEGYERLIQLAKGLIDKNGFVKINEQIELPFK